MDRQYVGIDFHRRRSVIVRLNAAGEQLAVTCVDNDPFEFAAVMTDAGEAPAVVIEATYGWYWVVDLLQELGASVYLANPNVLNWGDRRVKNDVVDAHDLADMLRLGRLGEAWIAPPAIRQLRELVRYRTKLVQLRSGLKAQVHAVMAKEGALPRVDDMFGPAGRRQLDQLDLGRNFAIRVQSLRELIEHYDSQIVMLERDIHQHLKGDRGYRAVQAIKGVGPTIAAILVAEIGDVTAFRHPRTCVRGPDSHPSTMSPTPRRGAARSPSKDRGCCAGRSSKGSAATTAATSSSTATARSRAARCEQGARRDRPQGSHARLLRATRRRDPMPRQARRGSRVRLGHGPVASSKNGMTPAAGCESSN